MLDVNYDSNYFGLSLVQYRNFTFKLFIVICDGSDCLLDLVHSFLVPIRNVHNIWLAVFDQSPEVIQWAHEINRGYEKHMLLFLLVHFGKL